MPITEAEKWVQFSVMRDWKHHSKTDYYLAMIAYHIYLLFFILGGTPTKSFTDFLLKFPDAKPKRYRPDDDEIEEEEYLENDLDYTEEIEEMKKRAARSEAIWTGWAEALKADTLGTRSPKKE